MFKSNLSHSLSPTKIKTEAVDTPSFAMDFQKSCSTSHIFLDKPISSHNRQSLSPYKRPKKSVQRLHSPNFTTKKEQLPFIINNRPKSSEYSRLYENEQLEIYNQSFDEEVDTALRSRILLEMIDDQNDEEFSSIVVTTSSFKPDSKKLVSRSDSKKFDTSLSLDENKSGEPFDACNSKKGIFLGNPEAIASIPTPSPTPFSPAYAEPSYSLPELKKEPEDAVFPTMSEIPNNDRALSSDIPTSKKVVIGNAPLSVTKTSKNNIPSQSNGHKKKSSRRHLESSVTVGKITKKNGHKQTKRSNISRTEKNSSNQSETEDENYMEDIKVHTARSMPRRWTESDDDKVAFLREYGNLKWHEVTEFINGRHTPQAVQMRYLRSLKRRNDQLTPEETEKLRRLVVEDYETRFKRLSTAMGPSFTPVRIQKIFLAQGGLGDTLESNKKWTRDEIIDLVDQAEGDFDNFTVPVRSDELPPRARDHMKDKYTKSYEELVSLYIGIERFNDSNLQRKPKIDLDQDKK